MIPKTVRYRKFKFKYHCPLCRSLNQVRYDGKMSARQVLGILSFSLVILYAFLSRLEAGAIVLCFLAWALVEIFNRLMYRSEIPCKGCGFDPIWYKKDIRKAREILEAKRVILQQKNSLENLSQEQQTENLDDEPKDDVEQVPFVPTDEDRIQASSKQS